MRSSGIGMPLSIGFCGVASAVYGRYDFVRRTVNNVSTKDGHSDVQLAWIHQPEFASGVPFSRNSSS